MRHRRWWILAFVIVFLMIGTSCGGLIPDEYTVETTSELGPNTLGRIDDLNQTLATGMEIGPETRATIEELNQTIADGIRFGFTEDTLSRVDELLRIVEQGIGIKVGLDPETNATVNSLIDTIEEAPDQWEDTVTEIIHVLENSTSNVSSDIADEVSQLMDDAKVNTQYVTAAVGIEFRCNVDFMSARAGETVDQFIGRTLVGRLRAIISGEKEEEKPVPWVCQIIPDQIDLAEVGEVVVFEDAVIKISGYNYEQGNLPTAFIVDEAGQPIESAALYPFLTSPYQIQLNLQGIDFATIPERSRVVFSWQESAVEFALSVVFPGEEILPTKIPVAMLTINSATVNVLKGPADNYHMIGSAEMGAEYEVLGQNGDGSWFQIEYDGKEGWVPTGAVVRNEIPAPVASIPGPLPVASFEMSANQGPAPLEIDFIDTSTGEPVDWEWDFGYGLPAFTKDTDHTYPNEGTFRVTLKVENRIGFDTMTKEVVVEESENTMRDNLLDIGKHFVVKVDPEFHPDSFIFRVFPGLHAPVHTNTGIDTNVYDCGITGIYAANGDINERGIGNIIYANLTPEGNTWILYADFNTEGGSETWSVGVMCLRKDIEGGYEMHRQVQVHPGSNETVNLSYLGIPDKRVCGVVGFGAWSGDINDQGQGAYIMKTYTTRNSAGEWELTANFNTLGGQEEIWDVDVLCLYDDPSLFSWKHYSQVMGGNFVDTGMHSSQYACGITGMAILHGDIDAFGTGHIIAAIPFIGENGNWQVYAKFRTQNGQERWDYDLLCVDRSITDGSASEFTWDNWIKGP